MKKKEKKKKRKNRERFKKIEKGKMQEINIGGRAREEAKGKVVPRDESHYIWWFQASVVDRT